MLSRERRRPPDRAALESIIPGFHLNYPTKTTDSLRGVAFRLQFPPYLGKKETERRPSRANIVAYPPEGWISVRPLLFRAGNASQVLSLTLARWCEGKQYVAR